MKTYEVPGDVFEEIKVQLEGARDELNTLINEVGWFTSLVPERIDDLLGALRDIEEGE